VATLRDIKTRIRSVRQIQKITAAMKMVAVAKLRKHQIEQRRFAEFRAGIEGLYADFSRRADPRDYPLMLDSGGAGETTILVVTAERGLCGSYNHGLRRAAEVASAAEEKPPALLVTGAANRKYFANRGFEVLEAQFPESIPARARVIGDFLRERFLVGTTSRVLAVCDRFELDRTRGIRAIPLLPLAPPPEPNPDARRLVSYLLEPGFGSICSWLCEYHLYSLIYGLLLDAAAGEEFARMNAMELATSNADDLIFELTLSYNKARQEAITMELLDIVGGSASEN